MKGVTKAEIRLSLTISLFYLIFWYVVIFISGRGYLKPWLETIGPLSWQIAYVTIVNLSLHLIALPFIRSKKRKWSWAVLALILLILLLTIGMKQWRALGNILSVLPQRKSTESATNLAVSDALFQLFGWAFFAAIKFTIESLRLKIKYQQLIIEKKNAELSYLKSQTNPHFLFNTLNNIYLLTRDKSDLAPDTVLRLSDILRYMLYETEDDLVQVDKEIKIIDDYLELEKIRYDESLQLNFTKEIDNIKQEIPPLLMIPLIENAFKHGVSETVNFPFITISLSIKSDILVFTVENSTDITETVTAIKENIGIRNLRRQLELLFTEHELIIETREQSFFARMFINLRSYAKN